MNKVYSSFCFHRNLLILLIVLFSGMISQAFGFSSGSAVSGTDSLSVQTTQDEIILFNMINDLRVKAKLPAIPLSDDLCRVAHLHIDDLIISRPQDKGCSLQSWSDRGNWTPCCSSKDLSGMQCMKSKPREITGYPGNGYELIYWGEDKATPADAAELWEQVNASADMILSRGKWKTFLWKAMGVGIKDGYAVLWLGDKAVSTAAVKQAVQPAATQPAETNAVRNEQAAQPAAPATETAVNTPVQPKPRPESAKPEPKPQPASAKPEPVTGYASGSVNRDARYFLIVASVKSREAARSEQKRFIDKGYASAIILEGDAVYRIAVQSFDSESKARARMNAVKAELPGVWVFKK
jgi:hypothetical protein